MLGAIYATISALTFAMNNAAMRRGVLTGTATQAMIVTIPLGGLCFLMMAILTGQISSVLLFPAATVYWLAAQGILQFMIGRFFNYQANKLVGVNVSAPVVQLQVVVTMLLAVLIMREKFTVLQALGTVFMLVGSFATQWHPKRPQSASVPENKVAFAGKRSEFRPQYLPGLACGLGAAVAYGIAPLMVRAAFESTSVKDVIAGGVIAYAAASITLCILLAASPSVRQSANTMHKSSTIWFSVAAILVAISHGFIYASLAVAPLMVVIPILQLSLVFRIFLSELLNRDYEVMNAAVILGSILTVASSILVSIDTDYFIATMKLSTAIADFLRYRIDSGAT